MLQCSFSAYWKWGSFELGKLCLKQKTGKNWEVFKVQYLSPNIHKFSQVTMSSLWKTFRLILGLNTLRKCSVFKTSFKNFQSLFSKFPNREIFHINWAASSEFCTYRLCEQRRFRRACASAQSRQNLRCSLIEAVSQEEPSDRKPNPWHLWMAGHAQLKFVITECSKTQNRLTRPNWE